MGKTIGSFTFVLHSHLPYVLSHGQWPHGTDWLHEAALGCYLPLVRTLRSLAAAGRAPQVTLGVTPVLAEQLADPDFRSEFTDYLDQRITSAGRDLREFQRQGRPRMAELAARWRDTYQDLGAFFHDELRGDILGALRELSAQGQIELITCGATHGYFPLLSTDASIRLQVAQAIKTHQHHFGLKPQGIWLPECAYRPAYRWKPPVGEGPERDRVGVEEILAQYGISYFITDSHMLMGGEAIGTYLDRFKALERLWDRSQSGAAPAPAALDKSTLETYWVGSRPDQEEVAAIFTRDPETALTVWSAEVGYPGDGWYLDFHKKHFPGGLKYWRVTKAQSDLGDKEPYQPEMVEARLDENADHFVGVIKSRLRHHLERTGQAGHLTAPFDTELFGHWWFEGPRFLEKVLTLLADDPEVELMSCGRRLAADPPTQVISLPEGSWGQGGFHWIWLNQDTEWTWPHVYECEEAMFELLALPDCRRGTLGRVIDQASRELLLLQASDWQFLISTWSARDYAEMRFSQHLADFRRLARLARDLAGGGQMGPGDAAFLEACQARDRLFAEPALDHYK